MAKHLTAKVGAYSSVVGGGVHIHEPNGAFAGQVAFMCQTDTLRDKALQLAMSEVIAKALNDLFTNSAKEPRHCATSIAVTVEALWEARAKLADLGFDWVGGKWVEAQRAKK